MAAEAGNDFQVAIIGGGPSGLAAALTLSRSMIRTLVIDAEDPARNGASPFVASLPGSDRRTPEEVRSAIRQDISAYPYAHFKTDRVANLGRTANGFELALSEGIVTADVVLLATGMVDQYPPLRNLPAFWGQSIINCPFCHGIEWKDARWGLYADRPEVLAAAEIYQNWSDDLIYFISPECGFDDARRQELTDLGIHIEPALPESVVGENTALSHAVMADGRQIDLDCLLVYPRQVLPALVTELSLDQTEGGALLIDEGYRTSLAGVYAAGDLVYQGHQNTPTALHMGNMAAAGIVMDLCFKTSA